MCRKNTNTTSLLGLVSNREKTNAQKKKPNTLFYHTVGKFLTQIHRRRSCLLYTLTPDTFFFNLFFFLDFFCCCDTSIYGSGLHKDYFLSAGRLRSHGWKEETDDEPVFNLLTAHFLLQGMMGSWPTDTWNPPATRPTPTSPPPLWLFFFMTTTTTLNTDKEQRKDSDVKNISGKFQVES